MSLFFLFSLHFLSANTYAQNEIEIIGELFYISDQSHQNSVINCGIGSCTIMCDAYVACKNVTINCNSGNLCRVECTANNSCQDVIVNGLSTASLEVSCTMGEACSNLTINGANNSSISVDCSALSGCVDTVVNGADHSSISMECNEMHGCVNALINASDSASFLLTGCSDSMSCIGLIIACPPKIGGVPQCSFVSMYSIYFIDFLTK